MQFRAPGKRKARDSLPLQGTLRPATGVVWCRPSIGPKKFRIKENVCDFKSFRTVSYCKEAQSISPSSRSEAAFFGRILATTYRLGPTTVCATAGGRGNPMLDVSRPSEEVSNRFERYRTVDKT